MFALVAATAAHAATGCEAALREAASTNDVHKPLLVHSMPKTGSTTVRTFLESLRVPDLKICSWLPSLYDASMRTLWLDGKLSSAHIAAFKRRVLKDGCHVHKDFPVGHCPIDEASGLKGYGLQFKLALFPEARVLWLRRNTTDWYRSLERWQRSHPQVYHRGTTARVTAITSYEACLREVLVMKELRPSQVLMLDVDALDLSKLAKFLYPSLPLACLPANWSSIRANAQVYGEDTAS